MENINDFPIDSDSDDDMDADRKELAVSESVRMVSEIVARTVIFYDEELEIRTMINYNLAILERKCAIARATIEHWNYDYRVDGAINRIVNDGGNEEIMEVEQENEDPEENEDWDADLVPGDGRVDEPIDIENGYDSEELGDGSVVDPEEDHH